jgi:ribosomal protein S18 acetylase RimI-like enzyme
MDLVITKATKTELEIVHAVMRAAFAEYQAVLNPPSGALRETVDDILNKVENDGGAVLAWASSEPVGSAQYYRKEGYLYIGRVSVLPAYRGEKIGKKLMHFLEKHALEEGIFETRIEVRQSLPNNISYYKGLQYEVLEEHEYPEKTDAWYVMRKCLKDA